MRCAVAVPVKPGGPVVLPAQAEVDPDLEPFYHVILHNDDHHSFRYVVLMLADIFGYDHSKGFHLACDVHESGRAIVDTCRMELAEHRVQQIITYPPEPSLKPMPPMKATMEPVE